MKQYDALVDEIVKKIKETQQSQIPVEASGRHVHLSRAHVDQLFGEGYQLTEVKKLSQPGQFACKERVTIAGPKGMFQNVVILGPERNESQVEVSLTDARTLGIDTPIRESGMIEQTPGIIVMNGKQVVQLSKGLIVAKRHIHMTPEDAKKQQVSNKEIVKVRINSERSLIFDDVVIRISPDFTTAMHIDYDEANACGYKKGVTGVIVK